MEQKIDYAFQHKKLKNRQAMDLVGKIMLSEVRIRKWYYHWGGKVSVSFSGGKDSTVLLHIVRRLFPDVPAVFVNTGLEFPEIREFVETVGNVVWLKPKMSFKTVLKTYGFPIISKEVAGGIDKYRRAFSEKHKKHLLEGKMVNGRRRGNIPFKWQYLINSKFKISAKCCDVMKKNPLKKYERESGRKPMIGTMASESRRRLLTYMTHGCNNYKGEVSTPLGFWLTEDIWEYIKKYDIPYSSIYNIGYERTGCIFCMFGAHIQNPNKFQMMKKTHPKLFDYCMNKLGCREILEYVGVNLHNCSFNFKK